MSDRISKYQAGSNYVTSAVPMAKATDTVADIAALSGRRFESVDSVYLVNEAGMLVGAVPLADIFAAAPSSSLGALTRKDPPSARSELDREDAASLAIRENLTALSVVDDEGHFVGVFPSYAIIGVLRDEHLEDLHHMYESPEEASADFFG